MDAPARTDGPVAVIGAGITGLAAAWRLAAAGREVVVLEAGARTGGVVRSERVAGCLLEHGAQTLLPAAANARSLALALGLGVQIVESRPQARRRFMLWDGALAPLPRALLGTRFFPMRALLRALAEPLVPRRAGDEEESFFDFVARRFGPLAAERLAEPFAAGTFGGDARRLELGAAYPELARLEAAHGSVLWGALRERRRGGRDRHARSFSFAGGMQCLPDALARALGERLRLQSPARRIEPRGRGFRIHAPGGPYEAERVLCCVPPEGAAEFLPQLAAELRAMPCAAVASVHLAWARERFGAAPEGFGWLAPELERRDVLGCLWVSSLFPQHAPGRVLWRLLFGGAREPRLPPPEALIERALLLVKRLHGIGAEPCLAQVSVVRVPQYERGHGARVRRLQAALPGLRFAGWGYTGIGIEPCVREGLEAAGI